MRPHRLLTALVVATLAVSLGPADAVAAPAPPPPDMSARPSAAAPQKVQRPRAEPQRAQVAEPAGGPARYAYDAAGRLTGVVTGDEAARYTYDDTGNIVRVERFPASQPSVLGVVPAAAPHGARVTLRGTAFAATPADNHVAFNGVAATVVTAASDEITVEVPDTATSGPLTVQVGGATAAAGPFTVTAGPPVVTGMSPVSGPATTEVTLTGSGFDPVLGNDVVMIGGQAADVVAVTATTIRFRVPVGAASGRVSVLTARGDAGAPQDFFVPPSGVDPALIESVTRVPAGATRTVAVNTPGKVAVVLFDAPASGTASIGLGASTISGYVDATVIGPDGKAVPRGSASSNRPFDVDLAGMRAGQTYQLVIDPTTASSSGQLAVTVSEPVQGRLDPAATGLTASTTLPGQDLRLTFDATAGQALSLGFTANTLPAMSYVRVIDPLGDELDDLTLSTRRSDSIDLGTLDAGGRYEVIVDPQDLAIGSLTTTLSARVDAGMLRDDGPAVTATITRPGQDAVLGFDGTAGAAVSLGITSNSMTTAAYVSVLAPDGSRVVDRDYIGRADADVVRIGALPTDGRYRVLVAPLEAGTGALAVTYARRTDAGSVIVGGAGATVTIARPGQTAALHFTGTAGDAVSFGLTGNSIGSALYVTVRKPDGSILLDRDYTQAGRSNAIQLTLPAGGEYLMLLEPSEPVTGAVTVTYSRRLDAGTVTAGGAAGTVTIARPGQTAALHFTGTAGDAVSFGLTGNTLGSTLYATIRKPDGGTLLDREYVGSGDRVVRPPKLPATGEYLMIIEPDQPATGSLTVTYSLRARAGALDPSGPPVTMTIARPGQEASATFTAGTARLSLGLTANQLNKYAYVSVFRPDGTALVDEQYLGPGSTNDVDLPSVPAGTYELLVAPGDAATGSLDVTLSTEADAGAVTAGGPAAAVAVTRRGQNARLSLAGTAGQRLRVTSSGSTLPSWTDAELQKADGTKVDTGTLYGNSSFTFDPLPADGAYLLVLDPSSAGTGTVSIAVTVEASVARAAPAPTRKATVQPTAAAPGPGSWIPDKASLQGVDWNARRPRVKTPKPRTAPRGVTALAGHILGLDGKPLGKVAVSLAGHRARTDDRGRFLLTGLTAGDATLVVDGSTGRATRKHGVFHIKVAVAAGRTTVLPFTIWLPELDLRHTVRFSSPTTSEVVLRTPKIPGLEVRIPKGTVVRDAAGRPITELGITPIPIDRPPYPLPENGIVPVYFTVQPGGTFVFPQGAQVVYPNYTKLPPDTTVDFYDYDPERRGWYVYGHGKVSKDGRQVVPDAATRVWAFHGSMFNTSDLPKWLTSMFGDAVDWLSGDPVDLSTGLLTDAHTDLTVADSMPLSVTRRYWQGDDEAREFGVGVTGTYGMFLHSEKQYEQVDLYVPGGTKVHFVRTSPGTSYSDAVFEARDTAGEYRGAVVSFGSDPALGTSHGWRLKRRDGVTMVFPMYSPVLAIRDRNGNQITMTRSEGTKGRLDQVTSPNGRWIRFDYDDHDRVTAARDNTGRVVGYTYDTAGRLQTVTNPAGGVTRYAYDDKGRIATATDARGITYLTNAYDAAGRVARQTLTDGAVYEFAYTTDASGRVTETRVTEPGGTVRRVTFNAAGAVLTDTAAHGSAAARTTVYERGEDQALASVTDGSGRRTEYHYDAAGRLKSATELAGTADAAESGTVTYGGPFDQPLSVTDQAGHTTTYAYDTAGNLTTATDPAGRVTRYTYDSAGSVRTVTDPAGKTSTFAYRGADLATVTDPLGRVTRQFTDAVGRVTAITDPAGAVTRLAYDRLNQITQVTDALGARTTLAYDAAGNLTGLTDARGNTSSWAYDASDRPVSFRDPLGRTATTGYDAAGQVATATNRRGITTTFGYDLLHRPTTVAYGSESSVTMAYDPVGRLASVTDTAAAGPTTLDYDAFDRPVRVAGPQGTIRYAYDALGRRTSATVAGRPAVTYDYDAADGLTRVAQDGHGTVGVEYDDAGRAAVTTLPGGWARAAEYDDAGQLTGLTYRHDGDVKGALTYRYDRAGRIVATEGSLARVRLPAARADLQYDAANRLTASGGTTLSYDADGNLTGDGTRSYQWNARGQLTGVTGGGQTAGFAYDGFGRRTARTVNGSTTGFLNDDDMPVRELDGTTATAELLGGGVDQWFSRSGPEGRRTFLTDAAGSTIGLGDDSGAIRSTYGYEPYGAASRTGDASGNTLTYTGREDDGTGLMYYRARYYSPTLQRFISEDPIGAAGGANLYAYAADAPTNFTDPSGNNPLLVGCLVGGLTDGAMEWASQRLSGRKVDWGWGGVGGAAALGCVSGLAGAWLEGALGGAKAAAGCLRNSFTADTEVVMADGSRRRIADVRAGDRVLAAPGERPDARAVPRTVRTVIQGVGAKHLTRITIGDDHLVATDGHPFWLPREHRWADAGTLRPGQWLRTAAGTYVQITAVDHETAWETVFNLTVDGYHTYFVGAGAATALVHNCAVLEVTYKPGWTQAQRAAADAKIAGMNAAGGMRVTPSVRGRASSSTWRGAGNSIPAGHDIDHLIELQLGGADDIANMWPLDASVNRSIGRQIANQIKKLGLKPGDAVCSIVIREGC
ncbi:RHS repeat-associated core domain-containing protein [Actinoplanes sp. NPDC049548]|uniref:RHS repeat-associated core domain-containing protein n=1 Tax=Actinoplanes sp. NPDC049548 TaxID=3155152 RepID=UPI00342E8C16